MQKEIKEVENLMQGRCIWDFAQLCQSAKPACADKEYQERCPEFQDIAQHNTKEMSKRLLGHFRSWQKQADTK